MASSVVSVLTFACVCSPTLAYRARAQDVLASGGAAEEDGDLPYCKKVAPDSYPGYCDPSVSDLACYSTKKRFGVVNVRWMCSQPDAPGDITQETCLHRDWTYRGPTDDGQKTKRGAPTMVMFTQTDFYEGACKLGEPTGGTGPEATKEQETRGGALPETADEPAAVGALPETADERAAAASNLPKETNKKEDLENLPECIDVAPESYPGFCDIDFSDRACYSKLKKVGGIDVHWACSHPDESEEVTQESCVGRGWTYDGPGGSITKEDFYEGACKFSKMAKPQESSTSTSVASTSVAASSSATASSSTSPSATTPTATTSSSTSPSATTPTATTTSGAQAGFTPSLGTLLMVLAFLPRSLV